MATVQDYVDITYGYALVNGKNSVYLPIIKKDTGSTLTVVADVHKSMQLFRDAVPKDVTINFEFDESPTVVAAVESVATKGMIGGRLDRSHDHALPGRPQERGRRRVQHPAGAAGIAGRAVGDRQHDQHHVAGRDGAGDRHPGRRGDGDDRKHARTDGACANIAVAVLNAEQRHGGAAAPGAPLYPLGVHPGVHHDDPLRSLFMPLTLGVGFAMITSYLLSSMFVPIMSVTLLKHHGTHGEKKPGLFDRFLGVYGTAVSWFVRLRWMMVPAYLVGCGLVLGVLGMQVGTELFPQIDSGEFVLRFRPPIGSNFELTRQMAIKCLEEIDARRNPSI